MTTIVYDHKNKQIAIDSRTTSGNCIVCDITDKEIKKDDGSLWFISGHLAGHEAYSMLNNGDKVNTDLSCSAIVLIKGYVYLAVDHKGVLAMSKLHYNEAIGSGGEYALCALDFGKSAKESVEYTKTKDANTGGTVRVFNLDGKEVF